MTGARIAPGVLDGRRAGGSYDEAARRRASSGARRWCSVRTFIGVPAEVFRRLQAAPNAGAYYEDRIAEEYPSRPTSAADPGGHAQSKLDDLFGGGSARPASAESATPASEAAADGPAPVSSSSSADALANLFGDARPPAKRGDPDAGA